MAKSIYWCNECAIPIIENSICPICGKELKKISSNGICNPVFAQEKKLISYILDKNLVTDNIWYLGSSYYLINGKRVKVPYVDFYKEKKHLEYGSALRESIDLDDLIINQERYLQANEEYINQLIKEAEEFIVDTTNTYANWKGKRYIPTVSFSGGKDSTVVSRLVRDALQRSDIMHFFGDTTLEFPSTYKYAEEEFVNESSRLTPVLKSETEKDFFKLCNVFGPPSRYERWCCTIFKTGNLNGELQNLAGNSLTFLGIRHSESKERRNYDRIQDHSKIGSQINAMPIIEWEDCDVWLYMLYRGIIFNSAYRLGYKRVGCWCCPNNSDWSTMLTEIYYPELSMKLRNMIIDFAVKTNKTDIDDYIDSGKWKARRGASGLEVRNTTVTDTPCNLSDRARNIIVNRKVYKDFLEFIKPFGMLTLLDKENATYVTVTEKEYIDADGVEYPRRKVCDLVITWGTPVIKVLPAKDTDLQLLMNRLKCQVRKYQYCIKCSACDSVCPNGAINTMGPERYFVDEYSCPQNMNVCSRCIAKFYNGCITCQVLSGKK